MLKRTSGSSTILKAVTLLSLLFFVAVVGVAATVVPSITSVSGGGNGLGISGNNLLGPDGNDGVQQVNILTYGETALPISCLKPAIVTSNAFFLQVNLFSCMQGGQLV